jgi:hypothetical protein
MATEQIPHPSEGEGASKPVKLYHPDPAMESASSADGPKAPPWNIAFTVAAFCGLVGMMVSWTLLPARYLAVSQLQILAVPTAQDLARPSENPDAVRQNRMRQIASDAVLRTVAEMPDIAKLSSLAQQSDPLRWLRDNLQVAPVYGTDVVDVNLSGNKYRDLIKVLSAVDDVYVGMARQTDRDAVQRRRGQMLEQFKPLIAEVKQRSDQLYRELSDAGLDQGRVMRVGDEEHMRWAVDMAGNLQRVRASRDLLAYLDRTGQTLQAALDAPGHQPPPKSDPARPLSARSMNAMRERAAEGILPPPSMPAEEIRTALHQVESERADVCQKLAAAQKECDDASRTLDQLVASSPRLKAEKAQLDLARQAVSQFIDTLVALRSEQTKPSVSVIQPANIPKTQETDRRHWTLLLRGLIASVVGLASVLAVDGILRRVNTAA